MRIGGGGSITRWQEETLNTDITEELRLGERAGLGDNIAYLRSTYPREQWLSQLDLNGLARFWLAVHSSLRSEGARAGDLLDDLRTEKVGIADFRERFASLLNRFLGHLDGHHRLEDAIYFPRFRALDQRMVIGFDLLEADHKLIHEQIVRVVEGAQGLLSSQFAWKGSRRAVRTGATRTWIAFCRS